MPKQTHRFLIVFGLFWTAGTSLFLAILIYGGVNQIRALSFATVPGVVDSVTVDSSRTVDTGDAGSTTAYGVKIAYHYTVDGRRYIGNKLRFGQWYSSDQWASEMARRFSAGTHPTVYYNATNPEESVLIPGLQWLDLFLALFLTPFTVAMVAIWVMLAMLFPRKTEGFRGLQLLEQAYSTRIRPSYGIVLAVAGLALSVAAFISMFVVPFLSRGLTAITEIWLVVIAIALMAALWKFVRIRSGSLDVTLDDAGKLLVAPKGMRVPYVIISRVRYTKKHPKNNGGTTETYAVWIDYALDGNASRLVLEKWMEQPEEARRFATWLSLRLGVPVQDY